MNDVVIATTSADAEAVEAVRTHHAELAGGLTAAVSALTNAVRAGHDAAPARVALVEWCSAELLPHARAEEAVLYPAGRGLPEARLLVEAMTAEHQVLSGLVEELRTGTDPVSAISAAGALHVVFDSHLVKENDQLLPLLAAAAEVSLAGLLPDMHQRFEAEQDGVTSPSAEASDGHACGCGEHDPAGAPELDARAIPHAIRHSTIFGALDAVRPGAGLVLIAPHDPLPLLRQLEGRSPGVFEVGYLERGPETWRLHITRRAAR